MTTRTTLILPDIQYPYHDALMLKKLISVAEDIQPDAILQIGDGIDFPQVSRWSVGQAEQYSLTLQEHVVGFRSFLEELRQACPEADITWLEGNHDARLTDFIRKYAFPVSALDVLKMESIFGLDDLSIKYETGPIRVGTNVYAFHGHESGGYSSTPSAWDVKFTKRYGSDKSYVFGHTHQPFIIHRAFGFEGKVSPRFTLNVGSIMDPVQASYVKDGSVSWVMSFAVLRDDGKRVYPELVTAVDRGFWFNGQKW